MFFFQFKTFIDSNDDDIWWLNWWHVLVIAIAVIFEQIYGGNYILKEFFGNQNEILPKKFLKLLFSLPYVFTLNVKSRTCLKLPNNLVQRPEPNPVSQAGRGRMS